MHKLWPNLQNLRIGQATGLMMDVVSKFAFKLSKMSLIEVPKSITLEQTERKERPVIRHFQKSTEPCQHTYKMKR